MKKGGGRRTGVPERRCAGCGGRFPKSSLVRVVRGEDGRAEVVFGMKAQSRGVYVCKNPDCLKKALRTGRIGSSVGATVDEEAEAAIRAATAEVPSEGRRDPDGGV